MANVQQQRNLHRAILGHNVRTFLLIGSLLIVLLVFLVGTFVVVPWRVGEDMRGSTSHRSRGVITGIIYPQSSGIGSSLRPKVSLRINGTTAWFRTDVPVESGQQVEVLYRVGKSGTIYVHGIRPSPKNGGTLTSPSR